MSIAQFFFHGTVCKGFDGKAPVQTGDTGKGVIWSKCKLAIYDFFSKETDYIEITAYGKVADILLRANRGDLIAASGRIRTFNYTKSDGTKVYGHKFIAEKLALPPPRKDQHQAPPGTRDESFGDDDDIPF